jgi:ATP phosphoribosyltransferase
VDGAFISTDIALEDRLEQLATIPLGVALSELVVASRDDDGRASVDDLAGAVVATHMPRVTSAWFEARGVATTVVTMGGALEGVCAAGMADAIVDPPRNWYPALSQNRLRVLATITNCQGAVSSSETTPVSKIWHCGSGRRLTPASSGM